MPMMSVFLVLFGLQDGDEPPRQLSHHRVKTAEIRPGKAEHLETGAWRASREELESLVPPEGYSKEEWMSLAADIDYKVVRGVRLE